jgi:hypothetical protein
MPLAKQVIHVPFTGGLDTKTDEKLVIPGKLTGLTNGSFRSPGRIRKRNGYAALSRDVVGSATAVSGGSWLGAYGDELVGQLDQDGGELMSYTPAVNKWVDKGTLQPMTVTRKDVLRNDSSQTHADMAVAGGVVLYAWEDSRGGVRIMVTDEASGVPLLQDTQANASGERPRCLAINGKMVVVYSVPGSTAIYTRVINPATATTLGSETSIVGDLDGTDSHFDVYEAGTNAIIAWATATPAIKVAYLQADGTLGSPVEGLPSTVSVSEQAENCLGVVVDQSSGYVYVTYHNTANGLRGFILLNDLTSFLAAATIDSSTSPNQVNCTAVIEDSGTLRVFYEVYNASATLRLVKQNTLTTGGTAGSAATVLRSVGLAGKAWRTGDVSYVMVAHGSTLQGTYFAVTAAGAISGKMLPGVGGGVTSKATLPRVLEASTSGVFKAAVGVKTRLISEDLRSFATTQTQNVTYSLRGVSEITLDYTSAVQFQAREAAETLLVTGGFVSLYDGLNVVEHGFHLFPEGVTLNGVTPGGSMSDGVYQYFAVYAWTDNRGRIHRSAPSIGVQVTLTGGGFAQSVEVTIPTLRITSKQDIRDEVMLEVYRTKASGTVAYKVTSSTSPTYNDATADTVTFTDTLADSAIGDNEILYTTGGVLENIAPPAASLIAVGKGRVILAGLEDGSTFWYSKPVRYGVGAEFTDAFAQTVNPDGGPITALGVLDDKYIFFKRSQIYGMAGDGPNATGLGGAFTPVERVTTDAGCTDKHSVVETPLGLIFKGAKGFYLLDRGLRVSYIGAPVEAYNALTVTSGVLVEDTNQVRFTTSSGVALAYDYHVGEWSSWDNHIGLSATVWQGTYAYLRSDGKVYTETSGAYLDENRKFPLVIETAWIKTAGIQGFQRVYRALVLGNFRSAHRLRVQVAYDYQPGWPEDHVIDTGALLDSTYWGADAYWGESSPWGGVDDGLYQFEVHLGRQKCQAVRFRFEDVMEDTTGESYDLVSLALLAGVKRGTNRVRATKRM